MTMDDETEIILNQAPDDINKEQISTENRRNRILIFLSPFSIEVPGSRLSYFYSLFSEGTAVVLDFTNPF